MKFTLKDYQTDAVDDVLANLKRARDNFKNPDKRENVGRLRASITANKNTPLSWDETKDRPMGGMDLEGYCNAYARLEFFYRNFDHQYLPQMIRLIKSGKSPADPRDHDVARTCATLATIAAERLWMARGF